MSTQQLPSTEQYLPPSRPTPLTAALWGAVVVAMLSVLGAVAVIVTGKEAIRSYLDDAAGSDLADFAQTAFAAELDSAYQSLATKAGVAIALAVVVLLFAVRARSGARVGLAVALVLSTVIGNGLLAVEVDLLPGISVLTTALTPLLTVAVLVLLFMPSSGRYAAARKAARH